MMRSKEYEKCNKFIQAIAQKNAELFLSKVKRPAVGTVEFDKLDTDLLVLDMEEKFQNGEVRSLHEFIRLLKTNNNDKARLKVLREHALFERAINFCLTEAEANLKSRNLIDILKDFV